MSRCKSLTIAAVLTIMDMPTGELVEKYRPLVKSVHKAEGRWSGYETAKAESILKFRTT